MRIKPECGGFDEGQQRAGVVTILSVPIRVRERWWGSLSFDECRSERAWAGHEIATLETAAACIGAALERREIEDARLAAERVRGEGVEALNRLLGGMVTASRALLESADFAAGLRRWLECLALASEADRATLGRFLESERDGEISAENIDWAREGFASLSELPIPDGADVRTWIERLRRGELVWAQREELRDEATVRWWEAAACASCLIVPLVVEGRTMGWLSLDWGKRRERRADLAALLRTASDGAAAAIRRHEAVQALNAEREARAVELARLNRELDRRNRLLDASARASALLSASEDFDAAVREALGNGGRPSL